MRELAAVAAGERTEAGIEKYIWHVSSDDQMKLLQRLRQYNFTCAGLRAGFDARQASEADLTWQSHYKNRAISQCYALANYQKNCCLIKENIISPEQDFGQR